VFIRGFSNLRFTCVHLRLKEIRDVCGDAAVFTIHFSPVTIHAPRFFFPVARVRKLRIVCAAL
jgi:hypothetical protein